MGLGRHISILKTGNEAFHQDGESSGLNLLSFWQWSSSALLGNALRGVLAEYIVSVDVGCGSAHRVEWDAFDLLSPDGIRIEVKSSAYLQSWEQKALSKIIFGIQKTYGWDAACNQQKNVLERQADVYVFCVLSHKDKNTVDPLNLSQWDFYCLPSSVLNEKVGDQKTIALSSLITLNPVKCQFGSIGKTIKALFP